MTKKVWESVCLQSDTRCMLTGVRKERGVLAIQGGKPSLGSTQLDGLLPALLCWVRTGHSSHLSSQLQLLRDGDLTSAGTISFCRTEGWAGLKWPPGDNPGYLPPPRPQSPQSPVRGARSHPLEPPWALDSLHLLPPRCGLLSPDPPSGRVEIIW